MVFGRKSTPGRLHVLAGEQRRAHTHAQACTGTTLAGSSGAQRGKAGMFLFLPLFHSKPCQLPSYLSYVQHSCQGSIQMKGLKHDTEAPTPLPFQSNYRIHLSARRREERGPGSVKRLWQLPVNLMGPNF